MIVAFNLLASSFQIKAEGFQTLDDNKWTIGVGTCWTACALAGILAFKYSIKEQKILEREVPEELEKVKDEANDLNNPVVQKLVTDHKGNYQREFFKINWLNFYRKLHEKNKKVSEKLVSIYHKRTASKWASIAMGVTGLILLFPALAEKKIIE